MLSEPFSLDTQVTLLLVSRLLEHGEPVTSLLRPSEYGRLVKAVKEMRLSPADLLGDIDLSRVAASSEIETKRLEALLLRGFAFATASEKWIGQGIWALGWTDPDYPECYKEKLKSQAPPVLYGIGSCESLSAGGVAIVGSRNIDESGIWFARKIAERCAESGKAVISGGARGVDSEAMLAAVEQGGRAIGILADNLSRQAVSGKFRDAVVEGTLTLVSPFEPEARFMVGSAMARNKLIYALADYALVISSDHEAGGTWAGATENLKKRWTPLFVRSGDDVPEGNLRLIDAGGIPMTPDVLEGDVLKWVGEQVSQHTIENSPTQGTLPLF